MHSAWLSWKSTRLPRMQTNRLQYFIISLAVIDHYRSSLLPYRTPLRNSSVTFACTGPTLKLRRFFVLRKYGNLIESMYSDIRDVTADDVATSSLNMSPNQHVWMSTTKHSEHFPTWPLLYAYLSFSAGAASTTKMLSNHSSWAGRSNRQSFYQ